MSQGNMSQGNTKQGEILWYKKVNIIISPHYLIIVQDHFNPHLQSQKHNLGTPSLLRYSSF